MRLEALVFAIICIALLACMWRGGPCATGWRRLRERIWRRASVADGGLRSSSEERVRNHE